MKQPDEIGCGYCGIEKSCLIREPKINAAKLGCVYFEHWKTYKAKREAIKDRIKNKTNE